MNPSHLSRHPLRRRRRLACSRRCSALEPTTQPSPSEVASNDAGAKVVDPTPPAKSKDIDWNKLLNGQALMTETPVVPGTGHSAPGPAVAEPKPAAPTTPTDPVDYQEIVRSPGGGITIYPPPEALKPDRIADKTANGSKIESRPVTPPPAIAAGRAHVVQANETLSSISAAAYGSANFWPAIVKANPNLDPNRMKVGATVVLPDVKDVKPGPAQAAAAKVGAAPAAPLNASTQYRVEPSDSLYKISVKLYGNSSMAGKIYDTNKQMIGDDPAKLKVGQVLKLPEPPTVAAAR